VRVSGGSVRCERGGQDLEVGDEGDEVRLNLGGLEAPGPRSTASMTYDAVNEAFADGPVSVSSPDVGLAPAFALLAEIAKRNGLAALSMGMSADYETAIQVGATDAIHHAHAPPAQLSEDLVGTDLRREFRHERPCLHNLDDCGSPPCPLGIPLPILPAFRAISSVG